MADGKLVPMLKTQHIWHGPSKGSVSQYPGEFTMDQIHAIYRLQAKLSLYDDNTFTMVEEFLLRKSDRWSADEFEKLSSIVKDFMHKNNIVVVEQKKNDVQKKVVESRKPFSNRTDKKHYRKGF